MLGELTAAHPGGGLQLDGLMPIGRLDEQSEGLLLLTTDGSLSFAITNSKGRIEKEYLAQLDGYLSDEALKALREGVGITKKVGSGGFVNQDAEFEESTGFDMSDDDDEDNDDNSNKIPLTRGENGGRGATRGGIQSARCSPHLAVPVAVERLAEPPDLPERRWPIKHRGPTSWCRITLTEGKYRQVRRMTAAVGHPTLRLVRVRVGPVELGKLRPGQLRTLGHEEVSAIWAQAGKGSGANVA